MADPAGEPVVYTENAFVRFGLPGSELRTVASSDGVVFAEYMDVFEING